MENRITELMAQVLGYLPQETVNAWVDEELIHTDGDRDAAMKIVAEHVAEHGVGYYPKLFELMRNMK